MPGTRLLKWSRPEAIRRLGTYQKIRIGFLIVATIIALLCATIIAGNVDRFRKSSGDLQGFELARSAMVAASIVSNERGPMNNLLVNPQPDDARERYELAVARAASDQALVRFRRLAAQQGARGDEQAASAPTIIDGVGLRLARARREVDALAARAPAQREAAQLLHVQAEMFGVVDALMPLTDDLLIRLTRNNPGVAGAVILARQAGNLREYSGRLGSKLVAALFARQPLADRPLLEIAHLSGQIDELRAMISSNIKPYLDDAPLSRDFRQLRGSMGGGLMPLAASIVAQGRDGVYGMSAADFSRQVVVYFRASELLRDRAMAIASREAVASCDLARARVVVSVAMTLLSFVILLVFARGAQSALLKPLGVLGKRIAALGDGDSASVIRPPAAAGPELVHVYHAFEMLREAQARREVLERQRTDMLMLFSHDMRAPLTSLIMLAGAPGSASGDDTRQRLERVEKLARHTLAMADGFVQVSRAEASEFDSIPVNLSDLLNEARDTIWPVAHDRQIAIDDVPRRDDAMVHGDPALLSRALINLLSNAVKYTTPHTRVECAVEIIDNRAAVRCTIRDHGYGIDAEAQRHLFERYRRFRLEGRPETSGVGLGLAFVKAVITRHRGEIRVQSAAWQGTTVTITLPAAREA
ncbi:sensor histidine kinase [Burkholderia plantarii]|uniref:sensor histidine kinase n=1 Tax=Burkholderia plantarii TaxID=41899 RepID=UPI0018DB6D7D|nr:HAMP domain-containing sensor histidine kinase [Burkholderia plantarii]MBI0327849.1 HAMP domain-containing histidine kinase [Burkholderia plantarii]